MKRHKRDKSNLVSNPRFREEQKKEKEDANKEGNEKGS